MTQVDVRDTSCSAVDTGKVGSVCPQSRTPPVMSACGRATFFHGVGRSVALRSDSRLSSTRWRQEPSSRSADCCSAPLVTGTRTQRSAGQRLHHVAQQRGVRPHAHQILLHLAGPVLGSPQQPVSDIDHGSRRARLTEAGPVEGRCPVPSKSISATVEPSLVTSGAWPLVRPRAPSSSTPVI